MDNPGATKKRQVIVAKALPSTGSPHKSPSSIGKTKTKPLFVSRKITDNDDIDSFVPDFRNNRSPMEPRKEDRKPEHYQSRSILGTGRTFKQGHA